MLYDILQVEDEPIVRESTQHNAQRIGLSYLGAACLDDFSSILKEHKARYYIIDGNFPEETGGQVKELADSAVKIIRTADPDAKIIVYSSSMSADKIAERNKIEAYSKSVLPRLLVADLSERISGKK